MNYYLICHTKTSTLYLSDCVSFRFVKERYTPYTYLEGSWLLSSPDCGEIVSAAFVYGQKTLHFGYPCGAEIITQEGKHILKLKSRGYTDALSVNQPTAGIVSNVNLESLATSSVTCPNITYEQQTPEVNYVNYYDGTTIWDAIVCYAIRATGTYPYIRGANQVCVNKPSVPATVAVSPSELISRGHGNDYSRLISSISSADVTGNANVYLASDSDVSERGIIRHKDIIFDREWIMAPEVGLQAKLDYAKRGFVFDSFTVSGYDGQDILDSLTLPDEEYQSEISKLTLTGGKDKPIITEMLCYHDGYTD